MRRFLYAACLFSAIIPLETKAQVGEADALRYSQDILGGTARFAAMGGAFCAVGGDLSTLSYNPAGVAVFTKNQLEITPGLTLQSTNSNYNGYTSTNEDNVATLQSVGLVGTSKVRKRNKDDVGGWKSYSFAFAYNRLNNFNDNVTVEGYNHSSTLLNDLTSEANGTNYNNLEPFKLSPAFNAGLLDTVAGSNASQYFNIIQSALSSGNGDYILQQENINTTGSMGEFDFSFGGNYNDKLFIGATIGIVDVNYNLTDSYTETAEYTDATYGFQNFSYMQNLSTSGTGYNFKIGFIYRLMDWLRIGGAINSPTFFNMTDNYSTTWEANFGPSNYSGSGGQVTTYSDGQPLGAQTSYGYNLTTPLKAIGGAAVVINNQGIISADYEYVNYSTINLNSSDPNLPSGYIPALNTAISQDFVQANNLRFGFEWVLYPISFRAGYAIYGNPYNEGTVGYSSVRSSYSAGIGLKVNNVFFDFAYTLMQYSEQYQMYSEASPSTLKTNITNVIFTLGYNFGPAKNHTPRRQRYAPYSPPPPPPPPAGY
jgi:hypothetical protein